MTNPSKARTAVAILTVTALGGLTSWAGSAGAHTEATAYKIALDDQDKVVVDDPIHINMRRGAEVTTTSLIVRPGGHTFWHYHPGPHVVAVTAGTVTVFETDCTPRGTFTAGHGFFDPGSAKPRRIHTLYNPPPADGTEGVPAEVTITDFREQGGMCGIQFFEAHIDCQLLPTARFVDLLTRVGFREVGVIEVTPVHVVVHGTK